MRARRNLVPRWISLYNCKQWQRSAPFWIAPAGYSPPIVEDVCVCVGDVVGGIRISLTFSVYIYITYTHWCTVYMYMDTKYHFDTLVVV